jgi:hypothetical protein
MEPIDLKWLRNGARGKTGVTWGIPWKKGKRTAETEFRILDETDGSYPVQTWPLAYWPDGSLKWTAHAAVLDTEKKYRLTEGHADSGQTIRVSQNGKILEITNGNMACRITEGGKNFLDSVTLAGRTVCSGAKLVALLEHRTKTPDGCTAEIREYTGRVSSVRLLQKGPVRCAVEIRGEHCSSNEKREWLPYVLRLYFYAGDPRIHIVHTFLYDGDPQKDFLKGIGLEVKTPMEGPAYNRHICFGGDTGLFREPAQLLQSWHPRIPPEIFRSQLRGEAVQLDGEETASVRAAAEEIPVWNGYKLTQDSASHYRIDKRTGEGCCWVHAVDGERAPGFAYAGGETGGLGIGVHDFWQKYPRSIEIEGAAEDTASIRAWLYTPDAEAMDLRHYDKRSYVQTYYEGAKEIRSTPCGIANTNELDLWCLGPSPAQPALENCVQCLRNPPVVVCRPEYYHHAGAFGVWSLPDRNCVRRARIEDQLDRLADFYRDEIDRRGWYGFWNYGDVMHTYDGSRHCWKYDMGGYAWDNTELMSDLTLWYQFLRTGRADLFTMARAMTRHSSEVDTYHAGPYKGLGSRHNVLHWGDGCKEARIAMAAHNRFLYYLTADERLGEIMCETADADYSTLALDPMRAYYPKGRFPTHARTGPDWASYVSNWMTMWERFGDQKYHQKILTGIECLKKMPFRMISGPVFGYDPATGKLKFFTESAGQHLMICQGEPEVWMELSQMIRDPEWDRMLAEYGRFYLLPPKEKVRKTGLPVKEKGWSFPTFACSMAAFAAKYYGDAELASEVWSILDKDAVMSFQPQKIGDGEYVRPVTEIPNLSTNEASQWAVNTIQCLELIGSALPKE